MNPTDQSNVPRTAVDSGIPTENSINSTSIITANNGLSAIPVEPMNTTMDNNLGPSISAVSSSPPSAENIQPPIIVNPADQSNVPGTAEIGTVQAAVGSSIPTENSINSTSIITANNRLSAIPVEPMNTTVDNNLGPSTGSSVSAVSSSPPPAENIRPQRITNRTTIISFANENDPRIVVLDLNNLPPGFSIVTPRSSGICPLLSRRMDLIWRCRNGRVTFIMENNTVHVLPSSRVRRVNRNVADQFIRENRRIQIDRNGADQFIRQNQRIQIGRNGAGEFIRQNQRIQIARTATDEFVRDTPIGIERNDPGEFIREIPRIGIDLDATGQFVRENQRIEIAREDAGQFVREIPRRESIPLPRVRRVNRNDADQFIGENPRNQMVPPPPNPASPTSILQRERDLKAREKLIRQHTTLSTYRSPIYKRGQPKPKDVNCVVCLNKICNDQLIRGLKCLHMSHARCIFKWLKTEDTCPACRTRFDIDQTESNLNDNGNGNLDVQPMQGDQDGNDNNQVLDDMADDGAGANNDNTGGV